MSKEQIYEKLVELNANIIKIKEQIRFLESNKADLIIRYHLVESKIVQDMNKLQICSLEKPIGKTPITFVKELAVAASIISNEDKKQAQRYDSQFGTRFINWVINGQGLKAWVKEQLLGKAKIPPFITYQEYTIIKIKPYQEVR
jgi:hypothetical protein